MTAQPWAVIEFARKCVRSLDNRVNQTDDDSGGVACADLDERSGQARSPCRGRKYLLLLLGHPAAAGHDHGADMTESDIAIIGAGFGGLGAAIQLKRTGDHDFVVFEQAEDIGGTWRDNSYPGCACDVPSHLYSFSFALNPDWSDTFSGQAEIWDYLRGCAERFGIRPHLRLGCGVDNAVWDEAGARWRLTTPAGEHWPGCWSWRPGR